MWCSCQLKEADEVLFVDPYTGCKHTKDCVNKEIDYLVEHFNPSSKHPCGLTYRERIEQLRKLIS